MGRLRAEARGEGAGDGGTCGDCAEGDGVRGGDGGDSGDGGDGKGRGGGGDAAGGEGSGGGGGKEGGGGQRGPGVAMAARLGAILAASEWDKDEVRTVVMQGALRKRCGGRLGPLPRPSERRL